MNVILARRSAALVLIIAALGQFVLAATHAHAAPREPGLVAASDARGAGHPAGRDDLGACAVCKGLLQRRDFMHRGAAPAPVAPAVRFPQPPAAGPHLRPSLLSTPTESRAPPPRS
jgi:hypothetical protein